MEAKASLVGADSIVELETIAGVYLNIAVVVHPHYLESETAVRLHDSFGNFVGLEFGVTVIGFLNGSEHFAHGLQVFAFSGMLALQFCH